MPIYHVYYVPYLEAFRVYNPLYPQQTVAYVEDLSEINDAGFDYVLEENIEQ